MKHIFILFLLFYSVVANANANAKYSNFIDKQIELTYKMNDTNLSQEDASTLVKTQEDFYEDELYKLMTNKSYYIKNLQDYSSKIFSLKKIIAINKRAGNSYAVIRDEVQIKSYLIAKDINNLMKNFLLSLNSKTIKEFENKLNQYTSQNQKQLGSIVKDDYKNILLQDDSSQVLHAAKENVRQYYALQDINNDVIAYLYKFKKKMYGLNKFSKYHLINFVVFISSVDAIQTLDKALAPFGLSVIKLMIVVFLIIMIYMLRKLFYVILQKYLLNSKYLQEYAENILQRTKKTIDFLIVVININIVAYIYNDFSSVELLSIFFDIIYTVIFTYFIYITAIKKSIVFLVLCKIFSAYSCKYLLFSKYFWSMT